MDNFPIAHNRDTYFLYDSLYLNGYQTGDWVSITLKWGFYLGGNRPSSTKIQGVKRAAFIIIPNSLCNRRILKAMLAIAAGIQDKI